MPIEENVNEEVINENDLDMSRLGLVAKLQKKKNSLRKALKVKGILPKGAINEYDNYEYFSEAQYKELFTELFSEYGIELKIDETNYVSFNGTTNQPFGRLVTLSCTLLDVDTGYSETTNHTGEGLDRGDKAGYKATTGALKKFLSSTFLVATKDDPEREDDKPDREKPTAKSKGGITKGQISLIKLLFKNSKEELKEIMKPYNKKKIEELTVEEASSIIDKKKGDKKDE